MVIQGESVFLVSFREEPPTIELFTKWMGDPEVTRFLGMTPLSVEQARIYFESITAKQEEYFTILEKMSGRPIGYIFLTGILLSHRVAREMGIVIGEKDCWGRGYGSEATRLILEYGFGELGLYRIELLVLDFNVRAKNIYDKLGFIVEGVQRQARIVNGRRRDVFMMACLRSDFYLTQGEREQMESAESTE
ncbi:MAG TPA: GNAT family protein [Candidatus Desulfaltia sp.]|nr:GNAT family protein [Candidatus Desulfaltia sp.]